VTSLAAAVHAFREVRSAPRVPRTPVAVRVARAVARALPEWKRFRRTCLVTGGFALLTCSAWLLAVPLGLAAGGVSLLLLDLLSD
jgi:hypothetical protein